MLLPTTTNMVRAAACAAVRAPAAYSGVRCMSIDHIRGLLPPKPQPPHQPQTSQTPRKSWRHAKVPKHITSPTPLEEFEVEELGTAFDPESESAAPTDLSVPQKKDLPYGVHRSRQLDLHPATQASRELPVYVKYQKIRSRVQTVIKHIYGDVEAMERDLRETLPSLQKDIAQGPTEGQLLRAKHFGIPIPPLTTAVYGYLGVGYKQRGNATKKAYGGKPKLDVPKWIAEQVHPDILKERSGRIIIRGNRVGEVKKWLSERGF